MSLPPQFPDPSAGRRRGRGTGRGWFLAAIAAIVSVGLVGGFLWGRHGHSDDGSERSTGDPASSEVSRIRLEPAGTVGDHPFTDSVVTDAGRKAPERSHVQAATPSGGPAAGSGTLARRRLAGGTAGLYGITGPAPCDPDRLVELIRADPERAAAWARLQRIERDEIPTFVRSLSPLVLRHDTLVTNSAYRDGRARTFPAVLQAGTAVLVDAAGTPRIKCNCGNPTGAAPELTARAELYGPRWARFRPERTVLITANPTPLTAIEVIDVRTGRQDRVTVPGGPPASTTTTGPKPASGTSPGWDEIKGARIPAMCNHPPATLVDGKDTSIAPGQGEFELLRTLENGESGIALGVPSPDGPVTAVVARCNAGGVGWPNVVVFFAPGGRYYASTDLSGPSAETGAAAGAWQDRWTAAGLQSPGRDGVVHLEARGDHLMVVLKALGNGDAECCPSAIVTAMVAPRQGQVELVSLEPDTGGD